ncbi:MAG: hypothetical protein K0S71_497 [Clostridia bacterium]|nr:hypothetical protein [Clostridia bacterium]
MYLLKQSYNKRVQKDYLYLYALINNKWQLNKTMEVKNADSLFKLLQDQTFKLDYAIITLSQPYRNILYHFYPHIKMVIDKYEVIALFSTLFNQISEVYEEVAVSIEYKDHPDYFNGDIRYFIYDFYHAKSKAEAIELYEFWQNYIPLNDKKIGRFVRVMEFYADEILNYFEIDKEIADAFINVF